MKYIHVIVLCLTQFSLKTLTYLLYNQKFSWQLNSVKVSQASFLDN